jgi:uncharacterized protein
MGHKPRLGRGVFWRRHDVIGAGRMEIYLPIAEISVNIWLLLTMGAAIGFLSGLLGVGGGFLMTPLLIFVGIPAEVAVGTQANQLVAASVSGVLAHWRRGSIDIKLACYMVGGSAIGTLVGVKLFAWLVAIGQIDVAIAISYVMFLGIIGIFMLWESIGALHRRRQGARPRARQPRAQWVKALPWRIKFEKSQLYLSPIMPVSIGAMVGLMVAVMGVGGGFVLVPAMIYLLGMPAIMVAGTSLFQIIFTTAIAAFLQAWHNNTVDILLALILLAGGVVGAQFGTRLSGRVAGEQARLLLALIVLMVAGKLLFDLLAPPTNFFSLKVIG